MKKFIYLIIFSEATFFAYVVVIYFENKTLYIIPFLSDSFYIFTTLSKIIEVFIFVKITKKI